MRHALALHLAPLLLRLGLGLTFVWAGAAKLTQQMPVNDANRAQLAAWGLVAGDSENPESAPEEDPAAEPAPAPAAEEPPADPPSEADSLTEPDAGDDGPDTGDEVSSALLVAFQAEPDETVRRVYGLALLIDGSANPMPAEDGSAATPLWPPQLATGKMPVYFAWAAAVTELVAGIAVLFGFFTRLGALPLAGTMAVAMWLTQIGPALQTGDTTLGVLPQGMFEIGAGGYVYTQLLWQFALLLMAGAVFCTGPGFLSIDRLLFGPLTEPDRRYGGDDDDVEFVPMSGRQGSRPGDDD